MEDNDRLDDFHMAAISWLLLKEWDNPLWSEAARNSLLARLTVLPWWLDDQGILSNGFKPFRAAGPTWNSSSKGAFGCLVSIFSFWY